MRTVTVRLTTKRPAMYAARPKYASAILRGRRDFPLHNGSTSRGNRECHGSATTASTSFIGNPRTSTVTLSRALSVGHPCVGRRVGRPFGICPKRDDRSRRLYDTGDLGEVPGLCGQARPVRRRKRCLPPAGRHRLRQEALETAEKRRLDGQFADGHQWATGATGPVAPTRKRQEGRTRRHKTAAARAAFFFRMPGHPHG